MEALAVAVRMFKTRECYESESSSSSDNDLALQERGKRELRPRVWAYIEILDKYSDNEFKSHFRISKTTFDFLLSTLSGDLTRKVEGCPTVPASQQLLLALWKVATMDSYRSVADRFNVGKATALRAVRRVTHALFERSTIFIQWPSGDRAREVMRGFQVASAFPGAIGAIDGTHIRIDAPKENAADYINRKGYHSIQLQLVCDHRTLITHCYTGHPGSVHDQRVFRQSEVAQFLNDEDKFPADSHILGDAAYQLHQHLLTPYRDDGHLTDRQKQYNYRHALARVTVERCIGLLKGRIRSLLHCLPMSRVDFLMAEYVVACCVLHNICTLRGDEIDVVALPARNMNEERDDDRRQGGQPNAGIHKRNLIKDTLP